MIAHLDLDAFYASVELLRRPELRGQPVVVSHDSPRAVVTTASYEARAYGVRSAMPTATALRLCPQAILVAPDFSAYRKASAAVWSIARSHVELVEQAGLDEGYLDLSGYLTPKAVMRRVVVEIRAATGLDASVGIGPNKLVAKVASDAEKPSGFLVLTREQAAARFADASPGLIPGIGPKTVRRLDQLGLRTLAAVANASEELVARAFGPRLGPELVRRANFDHGASLNLERRAHSESREATFERDIDDRVALSSALEKLALGLCGRLAEQGRRGRTIAIKVRLDDFTTVTRSRTLRAPTNDPGEVATVARQLLAEYDPRRPVRLLGVRVAGFAGQLSREGPEADQLELPL